MQYEAPRVAASIGCRVVDVYPSMEDALQDISKFPNGWVFPIPEGSTVMDAVENRTYEGRPLYVELW